MESLPKVDSSGYNTPKSSKCYFPKRFLVTLLGFFGLFNVYALRVNLNVAMVAMVNSTTAAEFPNRTGHFEDCPAVDEDNKGRTVHLEVPQVERYNWDSQTQGMILSSFFYGYFITVLLSGYAVETFGAKKSFGFGVLLTSVLTLFTPVVVRWGVTPLLVLRALEGIGEGVTFPAANALVGKWSPPLERSRISSAIFSGALVGNVVSMSVSGWLCSSEAMGGWPSAFYVFGTVGCIWVLLWQFFVHESPFVHPGISQEEIALFDATGFEKYSRKWSSIPWKKIATSMPMWAVLMTHVGSYFGMTTIIQEMPTYFSTVLHFDVKSTGLLTGLPNMFEVFGGVTSSFIADKLISSGRLNITAVRKIFNSISCLGPALSLIGLTLCGCRTKLVIVLYCFYMYTLGYKYSGYHVTHVDMCPSLAGTLYGITVGVSCVGGIAGPLMTGVFIASGATIQNWSKVFYATAGVYVLAGIFYCLFASAKPQPWVVTERNTNKTSSCEGKPG